MLLHNKNFLFNKLLILGCLLEIQLKIAKSYAFTQLCRFNFII